MSNTATKRRPVTIIEETPAYSIIHVGKSVHAPIVITSDADNEAIINRMIALEQADGVANRAEIDRLGEAVEMYESVAGHVPPGPETLRGILEVEMFKRHLRQNALAELLEMPAPRLSEIMQGKKRLSIEVARKLYTKLHIPADVILTLTE